MLKKPFFLVVGGLLAALTPTLAQTPASVGIGTPTPDPSAALHVQPPSPGTAPQGALLPRLTAQQRLGIASPATGLVVYQTDAPAAGQPGAGTTAGFYYNAGPATAPQWLRLTDDGTVRYDPATGLQVGPGPVAAAGPYQVGTAAVSANVLLQMTTSSAKNEMLYTAAELRAAGLRPGPLTSAGFTVVSKGTSSAANNFELRLGLTTAATLTGTSFRTGLTTVYSANGVFPALGPNTFVFNGSPFSWDGTSSLVVQTCYGASTPSPATDFVECIDDPVNQMRQSAGDCAATTGSFFPARVVWRWGQGTNAGGAYTLPATAGRAGQVLALQADGRLAFDNPGWVREGNVVTTFERGDAVGIGTRGPQLKLDVAGNGIGVRNFGTPWNHLYLIHDNRTAFVAAGGAEDGMAFYVGSGTSGFYGEAAQNYREALRLRPDGHAAANGTVWVDGADANTGAGFSGANLAAAANALRFGGVGSGEAIASQRQANGSGNGDNQFGLDFYTFSQKRLSITAAGRVGIGTSAPTQPLDVSGNARVDGNLAATGTLDVAGATTVGGSLRVGGTATPAATLHVAGASSTARLEGLAGSGTRIVTADAAGNLAATTALQNGLLSIGSSGNFFEVRTVSFPTAYAAPPRTVVCTVHSDAGGAFPNNSLGIVAHVRNVTSTGFTVAVSRTDGSTGWGTAVSVSWLALP